MESGNRGNWVFYPSIYIYSLDPTLNFIFLFRSNTRLSRSGNQQKFYLNSPLIRHAVFSIHSFQDQSWSYKLYRGSGRILFFIQMCKRCSSHLKAEYSTVELATLKNKVLQICRYNQNKESKSFNSINKLNLATQ